MADDLRAARPRAVRLRGTHRHPRDNAAPRLAARGARGMRRRRAAIALTMLLASCAPEESTRWLGYVEGEAVLVAPPQPGWITTLNVQRGQQVKVGEPLFTLD